MYIFICIYFFFMEIYTVVKHEIVLKIGVCVCCMAWYRNMMSVDIIFVILKVL